MEIRKNIKIYFTKSLSLFLISLFSILSLPMILQAKSVISTEVIDGFNVKIYDNSTIQITGYKDKSVKRLVIPDRLIGLKVTEIGKGAFTGYQQLEEVQLTNMLTKIGENAFSGCIKLKSVTIPGTVSSIESMTFYGCISLEEVYILYGVQSIGDGAFTLCKNLKKVSFASAEDINTRAFNSTNSSLELATTSNIQEFTREDGTKPKKTSLPANSSVVYEYTVDENTGEVLIEGYHGDSNQPVIPEEINGDKVTGIGEGAFENKQVTTVKLPATIKTIGANAFAGTGLTDIEIPDGVTAIGAGAFDDGSNLEIKGSCEALDEYLTTATKIKFTPYGPGKTFYHELKTKTSPVLGGTITEGVTREYRKGFKFQIKAVPKQGYLFKGWTTSPDINSSNIESPNLSVTEFTMPNENVTLTANFEQTPPEVLLIRDGVVLAYYGSNPQVVIPLEWGRNGQDDTNKVPVHTIGRYDYRYNYGRVFSTGSAERVDIPKTITTIHQAAFDGASTLKQINVAKENAEFSSIDGVLFNKAQTKLIRYPEGKQGESYTVPSTVKTIAAGAFSGNRYLKEIHFNKVETIDSQAFENCTSLTSVTIPKTVTHLGDYVFSKCYSLNNVTIPKSITYLGNYAFNRCSSLNNIIWETGIELSTINQGVFSYCSLNEINIPNTITTIRGEAFAYCNNLTIANFPASITSIDSTLFLGCESLSAINVDENNQNYISEEGNLFNKNKTTLLVYACGKQEETYSVPDSVKIVDNSAFAYSKLNIIDLSNTNVIRNGVFKYSKISSIDLSEVTSIGSSAFYECNNLTQVTIPEAVTELNSYLFTYCINLTSVIIPDSVTNISYGAFEGCSKITEIILPTNLTTIENSAFAYCTSLNSINIPANVTTIGAYAFDNCDSIKDVAISSKVTQIGQYAFYRCSGIERLTFDKSPVQIDRYAFAYCTSLEEVVIPDTAISVGENAFYSCTNLTQADVAATISNSAFENCSNLQKLILKDGVASIGSTAFANSKITAINLPSSVSGVAVQAFKNCSKLNQINVDEANQALASIDGILYNKNCTTLLVYPPAKEDVTYITPDTVEEVKPYAMEDADNLVTVRFKENVKKLGHSIFSGCSKINVVTVYNKETIFESSSTYPYEYVFYGIPNTVLEKLILEGYLDSTAEREAFYREAQKIKFRPLDDNITQELVIDETGKVVGYNGTSKTIIVPSSVTKDTPNVLVVDAEGAPTTLSNSQVIMVNTIGTKAFWNYDESAVQNGVTGASIASSTIQREITNIKLPLSIRKIEISAFEDCVSLTSEGFTIPEGVITIEPYAFKNCSSLTEITIPKSVGLVGGNGTPDEATDISVYTSAFYGCRNLEAIKVEKGNKNYADIDGILVNYAKNKIYEVPNGFKGLNRDGQYSIPDTIVSIGDSAFFGCSLTKVEVPATLEKVGVGSFKGAFTSSPASVIFNSQENTNGIRDIDNETFKDCTALVSVEFPETVERIGDDIFDGCTNLTTIKVNNNNPFYFSDINGVLYAYGKEEDGTVIAHLIKYPMGKKDETFTITDTRVKEIYKNAFAGCDSLRSVILNDEIQIIRDNAFNSCTNLYIVKFPANLTFVGPNAFSNTNLGEANLPEGLEEIDRYAFANTKLGNLTLPSTLKKIGDYAFLSAYMSEITIPTSVELVGESAFENTRLTKITFNGQNTSIANTAFNGVTRLTIYGYQNSTAHIYAQDKGIPFEIIGTLPQLVPTPAPTSEVTGAAVIDTKDNQDIEEDVSTDESLEEEKQASEVA